MLSILNLIKFAFEEIQTNVNLKWQQNKKPLLYSRLCNNMRCSRNGVRVSVKVN